MNKGLRAPQVLARKQRSIELLEGRTKIFVYHREETQQLIAIMLLGTIINLHYQFTDYLAVFEVG